MRSFALVGCLTLCACHGSGDAVDAGTDALGSDGGSDAPAHDAGIDLGGDDLGGDDLGADDLGGDDLGADDLGLLDAGAADLGDDAGDAAVSGVTCSAWSVDCATMTYPDPASVETDVRIAWGGLGPTGTAPVDALRVYSDGLYSIHPTGDPVIVFADRTGYPVGDHGTAGGFTRTGTVIRAAVDGYSPGPFSSPCGLATWHVVCSGSVDLGYPGGAACGSDAECGPSGTAICDAEGFCHYR